MSGANFWIDRTFGFHVSLDDPRSSLLFFFSHDTRVLLVSMSMWGTILAYSWCLCLCGGGERLLKSIYLHIFVRAWSVIHLTDAPSVRISLTAIRANST